MLKSLRKIVFAALAVALVSSSALACTVVAVGKNATVDGSAIITHNDDSRVANSRLYIVPEADWPKVQAKTQASWDWAQAEVARMDAARGRQ